MVARKLRAMGVSDDLPHSWCACIWFKWGLNERHLSMIDAEIAPSHKVAGFGRHNLHVNRSYTRPGTLGSL